MQVQDTSGRFSRERVDRNLFKRGDGRYEVKWTDSEGKYRSRTLSASNLTDAKKERNKLIVKRDEGESIGVIRKTVDQVAEEFFASWTGAERSLDLYQRRYRKHLKPTLGNVGIQKISLAHVKALVVELSKSRQAEWSQRGVLMLLSSIMRHAVECEYRHDNPVHRLPRASRPKPRNKTKARVLTSDQVRKLIASASSHWKPLVATGCFTGLRQAELLGLTWVDVDFEQAKLYVRFQLSRTTPARRLRLKEEASERTIDLDPSLVKLLKEHKAEQFRAGHARPEDFVFTTGDGKALYYRNVMRGFERAAKAAGLNGEGLQTLSMHDMRHTAISTLIQAGADVVSVQRFAGHSSAAMTLSRYAHEFASREDNNAGSVLAKAFRGAL
jgi:integrase